MDYLIVGAGIAGLLAAQTLREAGLEGLVFDKARGVGGRMATRRVAVESGVSARFDHGAQYFTVRDERFRSRVDRWLEEGLVRHWSNGFATPDGPPPAATTYRDGHPRYCGVNGMTDVPKAVAATVDVRLEAHVKAIRPTAAGSRWQLSTEAGDSFSGGALVLTPPVPQSLALLAAGGVELPAETQELLGRISYDPCFAVLALLDGPSNLPAPGGLWPDGDAIDWMADNGQKGISARPAVTIHASQEFSRTYFDESPERVARRLLQEAAPWLGARVVGYQVHRWRYSIPVQMHDEPCLFLPEPAPLVFAGDAFAGPRVEGAALSGLEAADRILNHHAKQ